MILDPLRGKLIHIFFVFIFSYIIAHMSISTEAKWFFDFLIHFVWAISLSMQIDFSTFTMTKYGGNICFSQEEIQFLFCLICLFRFYHANRRWCEILLEKATWRTWPDANLYLISCIFIVAINQLFQPSRIKREFFTIFFRRFSFNFNRHFAAVLELSQNASFELSASYHVLNSFSFW